ncbi:MAG: hypothetical protein IJE08_08900 [Clostridia bacterium]|nr:hypothetical protein [Clostridia bacterium]
MKEKIIRKRNLGAELTVSAVILLIYLAWYLALRDDRIALYACMLTYFPLAWTLRLTLQRHHRKGMRLLKKEQYEEALECFRKSEAFFAAHPKVDRFRSITMFMSSEYSYREMAVQNQAHILFRLDRIGEAEAALVRLLELNPAREEIRQLLDQIRVPQEQNADAAEQEA